MSPETLPARDRPAQGPREDPRPIRSGDIARLACMCHHLKVIDNALAAAPRSPWRTGNCDAKCSHLRQAIESAQAARNITRRVATPCTAPAMAMAAVALTAACRRARP
jgi:hypothetical protein